MRQTMARKNRGETFAAVAIQQNGAAISRSDFKNQIQNLRLQLLQITDSVHQAADLEQRIEISCHPRSSRQFAEHPVGLKIENILRPELRGGMGCALFKFHVAGGLLDFLPYQEHKNRIPTRDRKSVVQPALGHGHSIHKSAVAALEVANRVARLIANECAMPAR